MNEIYIKCIISFAVGILFLQMISSVCRCNNKDIVEGLGSGSWRFGGDPFSKGTRDPSAAPGPAKINGTDSTGFCVNLDTGNPFTDKRLKSACEPSGKWYPPETPGFCYNDDSNIIVPKKYSDCQSTADLNRWVTLNDSQTDQTNLNKDYKDADTIMKELFKSDDFGGSVNPHLDNIAYITEEPNKKRIPADKIKKFSDFGDTVNIIYLNYLEKLIINFKNIPSTTLYKRLKEKVTDNGSAADPCNKDMTVYIFVFFLYLYGIDSDVPVDGPEYQKLMVIHDRLTKYIPDILEKIQQIYDENCNGGIDPLRQKMLNNIYSKLLKNNVTTISFTGFEQITKKLDNIKTVYIVIFMICVTFIAVKFMGMFNMSLNV